MLVLNAEIILHHFSQCKVTRHHNLYMLMENLCDIIWEIFKRNTSDLH